MWLQCDFGYYLDLMESFGSVFIGCSVGHVEFVFRVVSHIFPIAMFALGSGAVDKGLVVFPAFL